jgi:hypothetical protein
MWNGIKRNDEKETNHLKVAAFSLDGIQPGKPPH